MSANLLRLVVGSLNLTPVFAPTTTAYTAATKDSSVTVIAYPESDNATVAITVGGTTVTNGDYAPLAVGENTLTIMVTVGETVKSYTVTITRSA